MGKKRKRPSWASASPCEQHSEKPEEDCKMNIADKMERESRLLANLVSWMESHGEVLSDRSLSNH